MDQFGKLKNCSLLKDIMIIEQETIFFEENEEIVKNRKIKNLISIFWDEIPEIERRDFFNYIF